VHKPLFFFVPLFFVVGHLGTRRLNSSAHGHNLVIAQHFLQSVVVLFEQLNKVPLLLLHPPATLAFFLDCARPRDQLLDYIWVFDALLFIKLLHLLNPFLLSFLFILLELPLLLLCQLCVLADIVHLVITFAKDEVFVRSHRFVNSQRQLLRVLVLQGDLRVRVE